MSKSSTTESIEDSFLTLTTLRKAYQLMCTSANMAVIYEEHKSRTSNYVHATARGHEARVPTP